MEGYIVQLIIFTATYALFGLGLNLQWGFTGLINFGHVAFMTVGAYTTVLLTLTGIPLPIAVLAGAALAALLGLLIGFSTLRLREDYLAIVTIGVSEVVRLVALNEEWLTRGARGVYGYPLPLDKFNPNAFTRGGMIALLTVVVGLAYWKLWQWVQQRLKTVSRPAAIRNALVWGGYTGSLVLLLGGVGVVMQQLKLSRALSPELLGLGLLIALVGVGWVYIAIAKTLVARLSEWAAGLALFSVSLCSILGLWMYSIGANALYNYSYKAGLMLLLVVVLAILFSLLEWLVRSPWGRVLKAIREDEEVAKALGKNVFWYKLQSLMLGGAIAGIAGAFYAWQLTFINPDGFIPLITFQAWTIVVLGGAGNNVGTLLGGTIFWAYNTLTRFVLKDIVPLDDARLGAFRVMIIGLILIVVMMWRPQGILGKKEELTLGR
ncbi:branched-chain amino acid ABC transporter permease [Trichocoleus sp. FACHB-591]|uniref:branched-chain amino acid ABC transporter permease n=1 Tax=Trichocoleus sp. FACHB-591 TaxID=2692872 RepID=UPI0016887D58|nr:branched-chain amino acid ABC transporter permease [Trichocoleus sp. FACHB-591]MBD2096638.1 branched-chain amino acid ABC transporter permease [Trichocoleus sp. FACHB-591]